MILQFRVSAHLSRTLLRQGIFPRAPYRLRHHQSLGRRRKRATRSEKDRSKRLCVEEDRGECDVDVTEVQWLQPGRVGLYREKSEFHGEIKVIQNLSNADGRLPECFRDARVLLLGPENRVGNHSVYKENTVLTGSYWDALAVLPGICPEGILGIYGLGSGTVARIVNKLYPERKMLGLEIDPQVLDASRQFMGLQEIEDSGMLESRVCDCLDMPEGSYNNAFAGIIVDLYLKTSLVDGLENVETWRRMKEQLAPGGKILANIGCGDGPIILAILEAFEGQVLWRKVDANVLVIMSVDPLSPDWENVPNELHQYTKEWSVCNRDLI